MPAFEFRKPPGETAEKLSGIQDFYGHGRSVRDKSAVDPDGKPIPGFTYPCTLYLEQIDVSDWRIFEYGTGNGTLYWADRAKSVVSVESEVGRHKQFAEAVPANVELLNYTGTAYEQSSRSVQPYDLIVVAGRWRYGSCVEAIKNVSPNGMIILNNAERLPKICAMIAEAGFIQVDFVGYGPATWFTWATSVFLSRSVKLKPAQALRPRATPGNADAYALKPDVFEEHNKPGSSF